MTDTLRTGLITAHLSWAEMRCHDGTDVPDALMDNARMVGAAFETVRARWNLPIRVLSGYRTPAYQAHLVAIDPAHAAATSFHCLALALDLAPPNGITLVEFWSDICDLALTTTIRGIGYASPSQGNYIHIDCRPSAVVHQWRYPLT